MVFYMDYLFLISTTFGVLATIFYLYSDMQQDDKKLDFYYTIGNAAFVVHLLLMGSFIASGSVVLAIIRNLVLRKTKASWVPIFFVAVFLLIFFTTLLYASTWQECLPAAVSLIMTYAFGYTKKHMLTFLIATCSVLWLIVGVGIGSYSIIVLEIVSILILVYRAYKQS